MKSNKGVSLTNVQSFIEGNLKYYKDKFLSSPKYLQEQYHYRLYKCKDSCIPQEKCEVCKCPPLKKAWVTKSCNNGTKFPDLMDSDNWDEYKEDNDIDIENIIDSHNG
jgi:hypothetical protein